MGQTKIEWTAFQRADGSWAPGYSFNPWVGCQRVSEGCVHCYAETLNHRWGKNNWGPKSDRQVTTDNYWKQPLKWNKLAFKLGERHRVFCASMADVFEDRPELVNWREGLFEVIKNTPSLDWLILTKRPENFASMLPANWGKGYDNVWLGVSVENQKRADERIPILLDTEAKVRFLSCEPLLEGIDLFQYLFVPDIGQTMQVLLGMRENTVQCHKANMLHWIIVGGESGHGKRPFDIEWARSIREECKHAEIAFFMKQIDKVQDIPADLLIRQFPINNK